MIENEWPSAVELVSSIGTNPDYIPVSQPPYYNENEYQLSRIAFLTTGFLIIIGTIIIFTSLMILVYVRRHSKEQHVEDSNKQQQPVGWEEIAEKEKS